MGSLVGGREGIRRGDEHKEVASVEVDATFARRVGLQEGMRASVVLHVDPPVAHTVNIEPVTAADWESMCLLLHCYGGRLYDLLTFGQQQQLSNSIRRSWR
jgi:hypothetical protein